MKIIKQHIPTKTFHAKWTIDYAKDIEPTHGIDLEDELAKVLQEEIDREIINDIHRRDCMLKGWTELPFKTDGILPDTIGKMAEWLHLHAIGDYRFFGNEIWFENKQDLTAFILRWS